MSVRQLLFYCLLICSFKGVARDTIEVAYYHSPPFVVVDNGQVNGINRWLINKMAKDADFHFTLLEASLDQVLTGLEKNEYDFSLVPLTITSFRSKNFDFTAPYFITHSGLMVLKTEDSTNVFSWLKGVFNARLLKSLGLLVFVIVVFGALLWVFERRKKQSDFQGGLTGLGNGIWWSAVTMTTVGFIGIVWMFVAIMIISGLTGAIASSITLDQLSEKKSSINDFEDKEIGMLKGSATENWLKQHFFSHTHSFENVPDMIEALRKQEVSAIAFGQPMLKYIAQKDENREFEVLKLDYNPQMYAFGMAENVPEDLKERIEASLLDITSTQDWLMLLQEYNLLDK
jgi:polar amino acid transport system substrate-binding protein